MSVAAEVTWSDWGSWAICTKSCGGGRSNRRRTCLGRSSCSGASVEEQPCNSNTCPGACVGVFCGLMSVTLTAVVAWSNWGSWTSCTRTCGNGRSDRRRSCLGGSSCSGASTDARTCNSNTCPGIWYLKSRALRAVWEFFPHNSVFFFECVPNIDDGL